MIAIEQGADATIPLTALNQSGGVVDLSSASITANVKESFNASSNSFQKLNDNAGGSTSQIEVVDSDLGVFLIKIDRTNISSLTNKKYFMQVLINDGTTEYVINEFLRVYGNDDSTQVVNRVYGTTAQRPTLTASDVGFKYFDTTIGSPIWWDGTQWV